MVLSITPLYSVVELLCPYAYGADILSNGIPSLQQFVIIHSFAIETPQLQKVYLLGFTDTVNFGSSLPLQKATNTHFSNLNLSFLEKICHIEALNDCILLIVSSLLSGLIANA